ncbi:MAG TPA: C13 family peptidase [Caulobacteraceae bacterium]|nr:C13 family peptidase [Caulobacteraceae bacterium]
MIRFGAILAAIAFLTATAAQAGPFSDWAAIVVAGDNHAAGGGQTEVFDNGRRDLSKALTDAGFSSQNILQFSIQADKYADPKPISARPFRNVVEQFQSLTQRARGGCLIYFTSHGSPQGIVVGDGLLPPSQLATVIDDACGKRPTVAVISACFSGIFVPDLEWPNRMVMTAARPDRTSFGCGATDRYTYFDDCFLQSLKASNNLQDLSAKVPVCVSEREKVEHASPPSEPQVSIGPQMRASLPLYSFAKPPS